MKVSYLGTTTLLFDDGADQILFDCHVTRPSFFRFLVGRFRTDEAPADRVIEDFAIRRLRGIFISHSHHDHVLDAPYFALRCGADLFGSPSALNVAIGGDVPEERLHSFGDSMAYQVGGFGITVLPSLHSAPTLLNNDLGQSIDAPVRQPAGRRAFKEGGSFDFLIAHGGRRFLIRPSYNYVEGQLRGIGADVLFLGITGLSRDSRERQSAFFTETVDRTHPRLVIPIHWDNFFSPLYGVPSGMPWYGDDTGESMRLLAAHCRSAGVDCAVQLPLTSLEV